MNDKKRLLGYICAALTCMIWGGIYVAGKYALQTMGPVTVMCFRYLVGFVSLLVLFKLRGCKKKVERGDWKYIGIVGFLGYYLSIVLQMLGTDLLDASLASLVNSLCPVVISILAAVFLKEKIQLKHAVGIGVSLIGIYIILGVGGGSVHLWGVILCLGAVFFWSSASVAIRRISDKYDPIQISLYGIMVALIFTVPTALAEGMAQPPVLTPGGLLACLYLGIMGTAVAHTSWNYSLKLLDASVCSLFYPLQPLTSAVLGVLLFGEIITWNFAVGGVLICLGVLVSVVEKKKA